MIDLKQLIEQGVHYGHKTSYWSPLMEPYIWGHKNKVHLIDVSKTAVMLERSADFLKAMVAEGKSIMWVGTKRPAREIIKRIGTELNQPYVTHRWIGGTLTNYSQVKKSVTKLLHFEDILAKAESSNSHYTKKELNKLQKIVTRLRANIGGISSFRWPVGALVVVDVKKEHSAIKEASVMGIPVVALVDTNSNPELVDYIIPGNDDAPKSINIIMDYLAQAVKAGVAASKTKAPVVEEAIAEEVTTAPDVLSLEADEAAQGNAKTQKAEAKAARLKKMKDEVKNQAEAAAAKRAELKKKLDNSNKA